MKQNEDKEALRSFYRGNSDDQDSTNRTYIPAKIKTDIYDDSRVFRVCAYCRVSTDSDEQLSSYELQQAHYRQLVGNHPGWDLKHIYADEGISGTSLKNRDEFNEMISACERGEYDLIVTKAVSRFARNLVDCISIIRRLKNQSPPVGVFFETDNLNTLSQDSEFMLSFLATFAQEESVKKRESMIWSLRERSKDENRLLTPEPLGYEKPKDVTGRYIKGGRLQIVEDEARIVRFIFDAFLGGKSTKEIAAILTDIECPTKSRATIWNEGSIDYILRNERYCGYVLTWKTFTVDIFEHKHRKNVQDQDQYLYTDNHEAIISPQKFEAVQTLLENRRHHYRGALPTVHVIDDGIFRGYIPIDHHWMNEDPAIYYEASGSIEEHAGTVRRIPKRSFSMFDLKGFQVVRGQFLMYYGDCPGITIFENRIAFGTYCMKRFRDAPYVQLLLHPTERRLAIRPCKEGSPHAIRWRPNDEKEVHGKSISCPYFSKSLYQIMEWNPEYIYRLRGTYVSRGEDEIMVFMLPNAMPAAYLDLDTHKRSNLIPEAWREKFGEEFYDYALSNDQYFRSGDWNSAAIGIEAPGMKKVDVATESQLKEQIEELKTAAI